MRWLRAEWAVFVNVVSVVHPSNERGNKLETVNECRSIRAVLNLCDYNRIGTVPGSRVFVHSVQSSCDAFEWLVLLLNTPGKSTERRGERTERTETQSNS